jgi:holo-ACP synthase CitX
MKIISDNILHAREKRSHQIEHLLSNHEVVVSIKVNFPGDNKNHPLAYLVINGFVLDELGLKIIKSHWYSSLDGPYYLISVDDPGQSAKALASSFEENHPLGRFLDVDVYTRQGSLSRKEKRKCYLCDQRAHVCVREKTHSYQELYDYIQEKTFAYYHDFISQTMNQAILDELNLDPKFGLVTPKTNGSHPDMDYDLMIRAKDAILPFMIKIFDESIFINENTDYQRFIDLGLKAEKAMYLVTGGINAYKGLIFHMGLLVLSYGYKLSRDDENHLSMTLKTMAKKILDRSVYDQMTFGQKAQMMYQMQGARGQALSGYQDVFDVLKNNQALNLHKMLISFIIRIDDTNLLKRAGGMDRYKKIKNLFAKTDINQANALENLSHECIRQNLTFGGSADLLILALVIDALAKKHEKINLF